MNSQDKPRVADERMQLFFKKLLDLKSYVKEAAEKSKNETVREIYEKLDQIIKEGE